VADGAGEIPGLDRAFLELLRAYRPSELGPCLISDTLHVSLPYPEWNQWSWLAAPTITVAIGVSTLHPVFTVPMDERAWLMAMRVNRSSGDNLVLGLNITMPEGYYEDSASFEFSQLTVAATTTFWPDSNRQTLTIGYELGPILLEPGSIVNMRPSGAGSAETVFGSTVFLRRMKLTRALVPYPN